MSRALAVAPLHPRQPIRLARGEAGGWEAAVATALERRHGEAMSRAAEALPGIDLAGWATHVAPPQPAVTEVRGLRRDDAPNPGERWFAAMGSSTDTDQTAVGQFLAGAVLRTVDPPIARTLEQLGDDVGRALSAQVTLTTCLARGGGILGSAFAEGDRLLVVGTGRLSAELSGPVEYAPIAPPEAPVPVSPSWCGAIDEASALLVPRGWTVALAAEVPTAWVEVDVRRLRALDVVAAVAQLAGGELPFREDIPWDPSAVGPDPTSIFGAPDGLARRLDEIDLDRHAARATATWMANLRSPCRPNLWEVMGLIDGRILPTTADPGGVLIVDEDWNGEASVAIAGHAVRCDPESAVMLAEGMAPRVGLEQLLSAGLIRADHRLGDHAREG